MRATLAIAGTELRRFLRDRSNIFFVFIFPLLLVLVLGIQFGGGGGSGSVAVAGDPGELRDEVVAALEAEDLDVDLASADSARGQVARGTTQVAVFVPEDAVAAHEAGEPITLEVIAGSSTGVQVAEQTVRTAVDGLSMARAQEQALVAHGVDPAAAGEALDGARNQVTPPVLEVVDTNSLSQEFAGLGQFDLSASSQVLLFVFLISLAASGTLIAARRDGVVARSLAAPLSAGRMMLGLSAGRWVIALFQGAYIMLATWLLFGVDWGNIVLALLVVALFGLVAAGTAMLLGALLDNEGAASGVGVGVGLVLAGIGGGMAPLEIFSDTMRQIAHVTPHAWAYDAFAQIQRHDGGLVDILPMLGVLAAMAAGMLLLGSWALRRSLARAM